MEKKENISNNEAWLVSRKKVLFDFTITIISAIFFATSFPPLNWSFAAWCSIIPLYFIVLKKRPLKAFLYGSLWGYIWMLIAFSWLREIEIIIPFLIAMIFAGFMGVWTLFIPIFRRAVLIPLSVQLKGSEDIDKYQPSYTREILFILSLAGLWVLLEWVRSWLIFSGFPWNNLGVSQWKNIPVIQICEYTGVYGISFLIIFFNIAMALTVSTIRKSVEHSKYRRPIPFLLAMALLMGVVLLGSKSMMKYRIPVREAEAKDKNEFVTFTASIIQGDIPQCRFPKGGEAENALKQYVQLTELALYNKSDIIIWPETAVPVPYRTGHEFGDLYRFEIFKLLNKAKRPIMLGSIDYDFELLKEGVKPEEIPCYNSIMLLDKNSDNLFNVVDKYNKMHLVPFGEYTPLSKYMPWLQKAIGMGRDLSRGKHSTIFNLKKDVRAGTNICFEDIFPEISANCAKNGANILLVLSNDAWYPTSSEPEQHLANSIFRAVETRLPMIRSGNSSASCLILPNGAIVDTVSLRKDGSIDPVSPSRGYSDFKVDIPKKPKLTFHTKYPLAFIWLCAVITTAAFTHSLWIWREKKKHFLDKFELRIQS
jgi:apolipoprotein N-acyltransferase